MAETLAAAIAAVRTRLDEQSARQWEDPYIRRWLWEGEQATARRTHANREFRTISLTAGTNDYTLPADVLEVEDAIWKPDSSRELPLEGRPWDVLNRMWGQYPATQGQPQVWTVRGRAPSVTLRLFPAPNVNSTLQIYGPTIPSPFDFASAALDASRVLAVPDGFTDLPINYATMMAMLMDKDASSTGYQIYSALFEKGIDDLTANDEYANYAKEFIPVNGRWLDRGFADWD
jgi:hypothetical protein